MIFKHLDKSKQSGTLLLEGDLNIQRARELQKALKNALEQVTHLMLDFKGVTSLDITAIQLLYATHLSAGEMNKKLGLSGKCTPEILAYFADSGFAQYPWLDFAP